jgi:hypothetical protein
VRTGEIYAHLHDLWRTASGDFAGLKAGRFYVPFGTETEWFRAPQNPLISNSAAFPYGLDEGVLLYGRASGIGWITAVTAGTSDRSSEDGPAKTINLKLSAQPWTDLDVSASFMRNGATRSSALEFGGSNIDPVGSNGFSTAGASPSATVAATLYELDAVVHVRHRTSLGLSFGHAAVDDAVNAFDRSFHWFRVEPRYDFTPSLFGVFRFSEIGTYDSAEGYHFDGEDLAAGNEAFGYDTRRFQRISAGLGWKLNPQSILKLEVGRDRFWVIDGSPADPGAENRDFFGLELVVSF